jgi:hypothetical protein
LRCWNDGRVKRLLPTVGNDKLLFLHIPKNGGTWVSYAMEAAGIELERERPDLWHPTLRHVDRRGRFTFAFVREPLSWYASWWQWARGYENRHLWAFLSDFPLDRFVPLPFPDFLKGCMTWNPAYVSRALLPPFVGPPEDPIDFIGHYENLVDDLVRALEMVGQSFDEEALRAYAPLNTSGPQPDCPPDVKARLTDGERETYERFYSTLLV